MGLGAGIVFVAYRARGRTLTGAPVRATPVPVDMDALRARFPFELIEVPGAEALARWAAFRAEGAGSPVILGDAQSVELMAEAISPGAEADAAAILAKASALRHPESLSQ